jgi:pyruvate ferredoxin oxidoreductase alpha subunit
MGSVAGTIKDTIDELNVHGGKFGVVSIISYRPFPSDAIKNAIKNAKKVVVIEKAFAVGIGGILSQEVELLAKNTDLKVFSVVAGLGGRAITSEMLREYLSHENLHADVFLGLSNEIVDREYHPIHACCK